MSEGRAPDIIAAGNGVYAVLDGSRRRIAYAVRSGADTWIYFDGRVHVISASAGAKPRRTSRADDETALAAPMPATVVSVHVSPGQAVTRGDLLITLEAMKMELAVKAPRDGMVRTIACRAGELVQPGVPLLELE